MHPDTFVFLIPILLGLGCFAAVAFIVYVIVDSRRRGEQLKVMSEFQSRLLDRMGSPRELGEFLDSEGGARFLNAIATERRHPAERILRSTSIGIVLAGLGLAFWLIRVAVVTHPDARALFGGLAILGICAGLAFLVSAATSVRLSRSLGTLDGDRPKPRTAELG